MRRLNAALLGAAACANGPAEDARRYRALLATPGTATPADCAGLSDDGLRGDCVVVHAGARARAGGDPWPLCAAAPPAGPWAAECAFVVAEAHLARAERAAAAAACARATPFAADCAQHLWQGGLQAIAAEPRPLAERQRAAAAHIAAWEPLLGPALAPGPRAWERFFAAAFTQPTLYVDLGACAPLPPAEAAACTEAGRALYATELRAALRRVPFPLCADARPTVAALTGLVPAAPDPRLQDAVDGLVAARCR
jgi:hypothetical protein